MLPYFRKLENDQDMGEQLHGKDGPIIVGPGAPPGFAGGCRAVAEAAAARGFPYVADMNGEVQNGFCSVPTSSTPTHRVSAATAYLTPEVRHRPNLRIVTESFVEAIVFDGRRATGVRVRQAGGSAALRGAEIIVAAGALHQPAILQRAGIGPAQHLQQLGIGVVADRAGVGANLQDHPCISIGCYLRPQAREPRARSIAARCWACVTISASRDVLHPTCIGRCPIAFPGIASAARSAPSSSASTSPIRAAACRSLSADERA